MLDDLTGCDTGPERWEMSCAVTKIIEYDILGLYYE